MISFLDCKQKPRPIVCHPQITFYLDRKLLALFNLSVFVIFKNGKKQDRRRRSVQKREHATLQGRDIHMDLEIVISTVESTLKF